MAPPNFTAKSPIPVYAVALPRSEVILYAGGGGRGRSGVTNAIRAVEVVSSEKTVVDKAEMKLSRDEDAPMCMTLAPDEFNDWDDADDEGEESAKRAEVGASQRKIVCGINSSEASLANGVNDNVRLFEWKRTGPSQAKAEEKAEEVIETAAKEAQVKEEEVQHSLGQLQSHESLSIRDPEQYIKVARISPDGNFLAVGATDGQFALHAFPGLSKLWSVNPKASTEVVDADFSADSSLVAFVLADVVQIYPTSRSTAAESSSSSKKESGSAPKVHQTIRNPSLKGAAACTFRGARFGRNNGGGRSDRLYTVVNSSPEQGLGSSKRDRERARIRKCFISAWDTGSWDLLRTRQIAERPATAVEMSPTGRHVAVSTSDLSLHLLSTRTLQPVWTLGDAHAFPSTCLAFSPRGDRIVSGSADMSLRVVTVDKNAESRLLNGWLNGKLATIILAICLALLAVYIQNSLAPDLPLEGSGEEE